MDLKQIRGFIYVANLRSFSKAARALNVAQPALSRQVQALEHDLRTQLLFRTTRGVEPTDAGRTLLTMGEQLLASAEQLRDAVTRATDKAQGEATIGLPPSLSAILAPFLVDECRRVFPEVSLHIIEGLSIFLEEWLTLGRIDLAILTDPGERPTLNRKPLAREELMLVGGAPMVEAGAEPIAAADLAGLELVITRGFRNLIDPPLAQPGSSSATRSSSTASRSSRTCWRAAASSPSCRSRWCTRRRWRGRSTSARSTAPGWCATW